MKNLFPPRWQGVALVRLESVIQLTPTGFLHLMNFNVEKNP
jgi:hypothetical protein